jgi:hypothetical protein
MPLTPGFATGEENTLDLAIRCGRRRNVEIARACATEAGDIRHVWE